LQTGQKEEHAYGYSCYLFEHSQPLPLFIVYL